MTVWENNEFSNHERVTFYQDEKSGLVAINAIHRLINGRCGGGIRFYPYASTEAALTDVLRLSRAMTYKMVLAGAPMGGGKTVIIGNPQRDKTPELLNALAQFINSFNGQYTAGPDVGTTGEDMALMSKVSSYVAGAGEGSTAVPTAYGVFRGIQACVKYLYDREDLTGLTVAIQGVGGVGERLCHHLKEAGAELIIADVNETAVAQVAQETGAKVVSTDVILYQDAEILAPCALGAILNDMTIPKIKAKIICGGANNQMADPRHNQMVKEYGILFAPDYVVNAGGVILGTTEVGLIPQESYQARLDAIHDTTLQILQMAEESEGTGNNRTPHEAAVSLAEQRLAELS